MSNSTPSKYLVFDLETTGTDVEVDDILEFGYILGDFNSDEVQFGRQYFSIDREVPYQAAAVNGLTKAKLNMLSSGIWFEEYADVIKDLFWQADLIVGHNVDSFDFPMLCNNFLRHRMSLKQGPDGKLRNWKTFDTMIVGTKYVPHPLGKTYRKGFGPKLTHAYPWVCNNMYNSPASDIDRIFAVTQGNAGIAHEALYDAWMTNVIFKAFARREGG